MSDWRENVLEKFPGLEVVEGGGQVFARRLGRLRLLPGLGAEEVRALLAAVDGRRSVREVVAFLDEYREEDVVATLRALVGRIFRVAGRGEEAETGRVLVLGGGDLARALRAALESAGFAVEGLDVEMAACRDSDFLLRRAAARLTGDDEAEGDAGEPWTTERLSAAFSTADGFFFDFVVCALEGQPFRALLEVERACRGARRGCLFVLVAEGRLEVGPLVTASGPGFAASRAGLLTPEGSPRPRPELFELLAAEKLAAASPAARALPLAAGAVVREVRRALRRPPEPRLLDRLLRFGPDGETAVEELPGEAVAEEEDAAAAGIPEGASALEVAAELRRVPRRLALGPRERALAVADSTAGIRTVCVLGGGTAGYLTALALRRKLPGLEVTVVESSDIPVIGVGEATTPLLPAFLHGTLGLDMAEFFRRTRPTLKLGIRFEWGRPAPFHFNYPFDTGLLLEARQLGGDVNGYCLSSHLMEAGAGPLFALGAGEDGAPAWDFLPAPFAYHIDNRRFVTYLQEEAEKAGIRRLDRRVVGVEFAERGQGDEEVAALRTDHGERLAFDFFVDASGFGSRLLGEALGTDFLSFSSSLFNDSALLASTPHGGGVRPYTTAETWDSGWCWNTPMPEEDHRGYVFSSAHATVEAAAREMAARLGLPDPQAHPPRLVRFRAGRHREAFRGNVFAVGNAYGFVEPLESTALHMVCVAATLLVRHFPVAGPQPAARRRVNRYLGDFWDRLRGFLALHFRFNARLDTPYWRDCRQGADLGVEAETLEHFREGGPLSYRNHLLTFDGLWGDFGRDVMLLAQEVDVPGQATRPLRRSVADWQRAQQRARALARRALPHGEALALLGRRPDLLRRLARRAPWLQDSAVGGPEGWAP